MVIYLLKQFVGVLRWLLIARASGFVGEALADYIRFYWIGMYFNLFLPTSVGGDVVRAYYLAGDDKRYASAFSTVVVDRLVGLWILVVALGLEVAFLDFPNLPAAIEVTGGLLAVGAVVGWGIAYWSAPRLKEINRFHIDRIVGWCERTVFRMKFGLPILALGFIAQVLVLLVFKIIALSFGLSAPWSFWLIFFTVDGIVTALPVSLGGIGLREGVAVYFLAQLGLPASFGVLFGLVFFFIILLSALPGGLLYLGMGGRFGTAQEDLRNSMERTVGETDVAQAVDRPVKRT